MPENTFSQSDNEEKRLARVRMVAVVCGVVIVVGLLVLTTSFIIGKVRQDKSIKAATTAAKKYTPNPKITNLKIAGGFALATVSDSTVDGPANADNIAVFKVNKDGSMKQIAVNIFFNPLELLELGIPLKTQAKLTEKSLEKTQLALANSCNYSGSSAPGYIGFDDSFNPDGWEIDAATLDGLQQALTTVISNKNASAEFGKKTICIKATRENSNVTTDMKTYISTFTLKLRFITHDGVITNHIFTFATGPNYYRNYTLDGQQIQAS